MVDVSGKATGQKGVRASDRLSTELTKIERKHDQTSRELAEARDKLLQALPSYRESHYNFGRVLYQYKSHYKAEKGWVAAARAIAAAVGCDGETIFRITRDYERVSAIHPLFAEALDQQRIDSAARRNAELAALIAAEPAPETAEAAARVVSAAVSERRERRKAARLTSRKDKGGENRGEQQERFEEDAFEGSYDSRYSEEVFAYNIGKLMHHGLLLIPNAQCSGEIDRMLVLVGKAVGREIEIRRRIPRMEKSWRQLRLAGSVPSSPPKLEHSA
ncbi:MAG TPA: hypothetical protein VJS11_09950 [Acidobacteriaceae bacterium]|nr:hypothetical protein [Acidobacteriaceae bacterium]